MRDAVRGVVIGIVLLAIGGALASRLGIAHVSFPRSESTVPWLLSRVTGVTALLALALDVAIGLLVSTRLANRVLAKGVGVQLHQWLSPLALALVLGHVALLLADGYIQFDALDLLLPFGAPYRPFAVAIGVVAAYVALVVHVSFALRKRIGPKLWRRLHYLSFVALAGAGAHAVLAGTDAASPWLIALYGVVVAILVALIGHRIAARTR